MTTIKTNFSKRNLVYKLQMSMIEFYIEGVNGEM